MFISAPPQSSHMPQGFGPTHIRDDSRILVPNHGPSLHRRMIVGDLQTLFSTFMNLNYADSAEEVFEVIAELEDVDPDWIVVQGILLELKINGKTVFEMDSIQHATLYAIAEKTEASLATANARSILKLVFNEEFTESFEEESRYASTAQNIMTIESKNPLNSLNTLLLLPNPAKNQVIIDYHLAESDENSVFEIVDLLGNIQMTIFILTGKQQLKINLNGIQSGIYICHISNKNTNIYKKLVITN